MRSRAELSGEPRSANLAPRLMVTELVPRDKAPLDAQGAARRRSGDRCIPWREAPKGACVPGVRGLPAFLLRPGHRSSALTRKFLLRFPPRDVTLATDLERSFSVGTFGTCEPQPHRLWRLHQNNAPGWSSTSKNCAGNSLGCGGSRGLTPKGTPLLLLPKQIWLCESLFVCLYIYIYALLLNCTSKTYLISLTNVAIKKKKNYIPPNHWSLKTISPYIFRAGCCALHLTCIL